MTSNAPKTPQEVQAQRAQLALMEQDCARLVNPDYLRPFASLEDAVDRLLPYHMLADQCSATEDLRETEAAGGALATSRKEAWQMQVLAKTADFHTQMFKLHQALDKAEERLISGNQLPQYMLHWLAKDYEESELAAAQQRKQQEALAQAHAKQAAALAAQAAALEAQQRAAAAAQARAAAAAQAAMGTARAEAGGGGMTMIPMARWGEAEPLEQQQQQQQPFGVLVPPVTAAAAAPGTGPAASAPQGGLSAAPSRPGSASAGVAVPSGSAPSSSGAVAAPAASELPQPAAPSQPLPQRPQQQQAQQPQVAAAAPGAVSAAPVPQQPRPPPAPARPPTEAEKQKKLQLLAQRIKQRR